jgi:hypothetical protein
MAGGANSVRGKCWCVEHAHMEQIRRFGRLRYVNQQLPRTKQQ